MTCVGYYYRHERRPVGSRRDGRPGSPAPPTVRTPCSPGFRRTLYSPPADQRMVADNPVFLPLTCHPSQDTLNPSDNMILQDGLPSIVTDSATKVADRTLDYQKKHPADNHSRYSPRRRKPFSGPWSFTGHQHRARTKHRNYNENSYDWLTLAWLVADKKNFTYDTLSTNLTNRLSFVHNKVAYQ